MSLRTAALRVVDVGRSLLGPAVTDMRPTTVQIVRRAWTGGYVGKGDKIDGTPTNLPPYTKVRHVSQREIASSGGAFEEGDVVVGPITPQYQQPDGTFAGFTESQLKPDARDSGVEIVFLLAQQAGHATGIVGEYRLIEFRRDRVLRFELVIGRERTTP
jgi:hypothetical protein